MAILTFFGEDIFNAPMFPGEQMEKSSSAIKKSLHKS